MKPSGLPSVSWTRHMQRSRHEERKADGGLMTTTSTRRGAYLYKDDVPPVYELPPNWTARRSARREPVPSHREQVCHKDELIRLHPQCSRTRSMSYHRPDTPLLNTARTLDHSSRTLVGEFPHSSLSSPECWRCSCWCSLACDCTLGTPTPFPIQATTRKIGTLTPRP